MQELRITADCGGSNGARVRLWKTELQKLADATGLTLHINHYPPGTSKWNKIEHRMFCHITQNWRGQPLQSRATVIELIANTTTKTGLKVECALDERTYEKGIRISNDQMRQLAIEGDAFHPGWNYTIKPRIQPTLRVAYMNWGLLNGATSPTMIVLAISGLSTASPSQRRSSGGERERTRAAT